ncbi:MAG TPA: outer membrane protein transport protein [Gemmatimonadales bacterium]|nr:outer membrane protein transport protein [Gemmatimonadales bacterium]
MQRFTRSVLLLLFAGVPALGAQGFAVNELGICAMGRAGVSAASPCADGSAIWFNPAGLVTLSGTHITVGGTLIRPFGGFTEDISAIKTDLPSQSYLVPSGYITRKLSDKITAGIGVFAPYGLGTKWPTTFIGRFDGYHTSIKSIYIQPTVAYQVTPRLNFGLGVAYITSSLALHQRVDLSQQTVTGQPFTFAALGIPTYTDFADATLKATGTGIAFNGGVTFKVNDQLSLGGHFITRKTIKYTGTAAFTQVLTGLVLPPGNPITGTTLPVDALVGPEFVPGGPLSAQSASTTVTMPDQGTIGFAYKVRPQWTFMGEYQQIVWGWFSSLTINFANPLTPDRTLYEGYRDSHAIRTGLEYARSAKSTFRLGYLHHTAAAPVQTVTPLLPEGPRNEFTIGYGGELTSGLHVDVAYQFIKQNDRRGRAYTAFNNGLYQFGANLFGLGLSYTF